MSIVAHHCRLSSGSVLACAARAGLAGVALLAIVIAGCGPRREATFAVTGVVTYRGQPVADAQVQFIPANGRPAAGPTDSEGRFKLLTWSPADGAIVGEHIVCITKQEMGPTPASGGVPQMISHLPARYASPTTSDLRASVTKAGRNDFHFDLVDKP